MKGDNAVKKILVSLLLVTMLMITCVGCKTSVSSLSKALTASAATSTGNTTDYTSARVITLQDGQDQTISSGGYYTIKGSVQDAQIVINTKEKVFIELAGVTVKNSDGPAIQIENAKETTLTLRNGTVNTLSDGGSSQYNAALFSNDTLIIEGGGALNITGNVEHGIESDDDVIINGGNITISAKNDGMHVNDRITVNGGEIIIQSAVEGLESKGDIVVNNGSISVSCSDDGINAAKNITINGGKVYARATRGDGLDSNGTIDIKGGTTVAIGAGQPECGIDADNRNINITGGTLVAVGGGNTSPTAATSTQCSLMIGNDNTASVIHIEGSNGEVLTFAAEQGFQNVLYSSAQLVKGASYTIYTGGKIVGGSSFHGLYTDSDYSGGEKSGTVTLNDMVTTQGNVGRMGGMGGPPPNGGPRGGMRPPQQ